MKTSISLWIMVVLCGCGVMNNRPEHREVEREATASETHPYDGFWKNDATDQWGLAIGPYEEETYYVSFCGPGGCFAKGEYRPITSLTDDPEYRIVDINTIEVRGKGGFTTYYRSSGRESTELVDRTAEQPSSDARPAG